MRVSKRQMGMVSLVVDDDARTQLEEAKDARESTRRSLALENGITHVTSLVEQAAEASRIVSTWVSKKIDGFVYPQLARRLQEVGARHVDPHTLMRSTEQEAPARDRLEASVQRSVERYVSHVVETAVQAEIPEMLNEEVQARGIPTYAMRQLAAETCESVKRLIRSHATQVVKDPKAQREYIAAGNEMLADLEDDLQEFLEDRLHRYLRNV